MLITFDLLPEGTDVFDQFPGVRFPHIARVIAPQMGTASGTRALSNYRPGQEFGTPLEIEFSAAQRSVRLLAGLNSRSTVPINAELRAFDASGVVVATTGPVPLGPGPTAIRTLMQVQTASPVILRVGLEYEGGYFPVIDDLEFDISGPADPPDINAPTVTIVQPMEGQPLTGEMFVLEAQIKEDRRLRSASLTISNARGTQTFDIGFYGSAPAYGIGPVTTGPLGKEENTLTITAEDFAGNVGTASVTVRRVPIEGRLVLPEEPIAIPRWPGAAMVPIRLEETFPGSLAGRDDILVKVIEPETVTGNGLIRDALNQPEPRLDLSVQARIRSALGKTKVVIQAQEAATGQILDTAEFRASITPGRPTACPTESVAFYYQISLGELKDEINTGINEDLAMRADLDPLSEMKVQYREGALQVSQTYRARKEVLGRNITAQINFAADLAPRIEGSPPEVRFEYSFYSVSADPNIPLVDPILTNILREIATSLFESGFTSEFKDQFAQSLGNKLNERIDAVDPLARAFLSNLYINREEFALGFCIPMEFFDQL